jgi:hypothetical protein
MKLFRNTQKGCRNYSTLQYISDIHLETRTTIPKIPVASENLALIGDIGNPFEDIYYDFLKYTSNNFKRVILISGNHEYWHHKKRVRTVDKRLKYLANKLDNVEYLNNSHTQLENYTILGSTLWASKGYNIKHEIDVDWLEETIENSENKLIVLTHYLPSFKLIVPEFQHPKYDKIRDRYATDLEYLIKKPIDAWLCGHSHCVTELEINNVFCAINAFGHESRSRSKGTEDIIRTIDLT